MFPNCYGIIPARYASTRFPGKPLVDLLGKPMFWHVYTRASRCEHLAQVVLATDDQRIFDAARNLQVPVVMTRPDHPSGTDRVLEAAEQLKVPDDAVVVNIQGDEPLLQPAMLSELIEPFAAADTRVTTLVRATASHLAATADVVTVVFSNTQRALYFSRSTIPFQRDGKDLEVYEHVGMYAFRLETLRRFVAAGPGILERREMLEQLRLLENDIPVHVVITEHVSEDIDRPADVEKVRRILEKRQQ